MDQPQGHWQYEFGGFCLDPQRRVLLRTNGERIPLKPKVLDTLLYLVEHAGELVERDTLVAAIWPNVIVEEHNLNKNISTLRHLFDETPEQHRFIVTEPGRGYRFVATVRRVSPREEGVAQARPGAEVAGADAEKPIADGAPIRQTGVAGHDVARPSSLQAWRPAHYFGIGAGVAVIAVFAVAAAWYLRTPAAGPEMRLDITTPWTPSLAQFAISPDGRQLVFVGEHEGQFKLWLRSLDEGASRPLDGTEAALHPFWSPDSRSVGFFTSVELKRVDIDGGRTITLASATPGMGGAWSADGTILYAPSLRASLVSLSETGGTPTPATTLSGGQNAHRFPYFLPGGRDFLFYSDGDEEARGIYVGSLDTPEVTRLLDVVSRAVYVEPGWLLFVRQGTLLAQRFDAARRELSGEPAILADSVAAEAVADDRAFSASDAGVVAYRSGTNGARQLSWFTRSGMPAGTLGPAERNLSNLALSPDGNAAALERDIQGNVDVWVLDSERSTRFTHAPQTERFPVWSPDGTRIVYEAEREDGMVTLAEKPASGAGDERVLLEAPHPLIPCDWSPDGKFILYFEPVPNTGTDLWVLPLEGEGEPFVFRKTEFAEAWGQFSPDGRWVAYHSNASGRFEVYVRPFPASNEQFAVSIAGGLYPRWSSDGTELYYIDADGKLMAVDVSATDQRFQVGTPAALFQTKRVGGGANIVGRSQQYDVSPDGKFLINVEIESTAPPITLLLNWATPN